MQIEPSSRAESNLSMPSDFFHWSFGDAGERNPVLAKSCDLKISWRCSYRAGVKSLKEEVIASAKNLKERIGDKKIALFHGGGRKSEILLRTFVDLEVSVEVFFLDFWGLNSTWYSNWVEPLSKSFDLPVHVHRLDKVKFFRFAKAKFLEFGIEGPNALAMAYLAENISSEFFPVVGSGGLDRVGPLYQAIGESNPVPNDGRYLPFSSAQVFPHLWSKSFAVPGEYVFFQSNERLLQAALSGQNWKYPLLDLTKVYERAFPLVAPRPVSLNWDGEIGRRENFLFRKSLEFIAQSRPEFSFWKKSVGCAVNMDVFFEN